MEQETLQVFTEYAKIGILTFVFIIFYSYAYSIYKREKSGERNFEKYSKLVLDDSIDDNCLEDIKSEETIIKQNKQKGEKI